MSRLAVDHEDDTNVADAQGRICNHVTRFPRRPPMMNAIDERRRTAKQWTLLSRSGVLHLAVPVNLIMEQA
ncbi:MAG: hypothetical protein U1E38_07570 [Rhodospirillales bacterium]